MNCATLAASLALPDSLLLLAAYLSNRVSALALMIMEKETDAFDRKPAWLERHSLT